MTNPPESSWYNSDYLNQLNVLRHMQQRQLSAQGDPFRPGPFELSDESDESPQHNPLPQVDRRVSRVVVAVIVAMAVVGATMLVWAVWG